MSDELVWIDLETTGLDEKAGRILEIGCLITDTNLNIKAVWHRLVGPAVSLGEKSFLHPAVSSMHEKSGLFGALEEIGETPSISAVDAMFAYWLLEQLPGGDLMLAGSTVHFDRRWMAEHLPRSLDLFHYRNADVSSLREFVRRWYPPHNEQMKLVEQFKLHRSLADLYDTLALASYYRGVITRAYDGLRPPEAS